MLTAKEMLDKIKWSNKFEPENIILFYFDRIKNKNIGIKYKDIKIDDNYILVREGLKITKIPLHRLREIRNKGIIMWKRK